ncbi:heme lyase CcmF/NrfE family subunit [Cellulomonas fimi]|uniref:Heme lyase CcmF/NrfE family subunit n=2 Tax=Cellulomonas fimi TaxID=1708 RepID=A0A7Y0LZY5_CELFI|nr:heme lyase CcmF/NrfE family subunit [Cellulomonas fimi]
MLGLAGSAVLAWWALRAQRRPAAVPIGRLRVLAACILAGGLLAQGALVAALLTNSFEVSYVAETGSRTTPLLFKVTAAWSALDGSSVLWVLVLAGFVVAVARGIPSTADRLGTGALGVMALVSVFFFGLVTTVTNPFQILADPPLDGPGANPLLQNHLMVAFHPPLLYLGYVGFTVPFAFAISALLLRQGGVEWLRRTRRANLVAWTGLTGGLVLGAWWSYDVLGWGGYWAWDPVENAALIPWLVATAFIHSAVVQLRRGMLQLWNLVLVVSTFSLTLLGTFLTRSSVIASIHAFTQSAVGPVLLGFFLLVAVVSFGLIAWRGADLVGGGRPESLLSREGAFLVNNVLLSLYAFVVLLGTLYPVLVEAVTGQQVSVGRPFFDRMAVPLSFALLLAMGVGPFMPYRRASGRVLWRKVSWPLLVGSLSAVGLVVAGVTDAAVVLAVLLAATIAAASVRELLVTAPGRSLRGVWRVARGRRGYWGGQLAHIGVALFAVSVATSSGLAQRDSADLEIGDSLSVAGYTVTYVQDVEREMPDRTRRAARLEVSRDGEVVRTMEPALTAFRNQPQAVATPAVWTRPSEDVYISLTRLEPGSIAINVSTKPFMWLMWAAGTLVAVGGVWALVGRRTGPAAVTPGSGSVRSVEKVSPRA